MTDEKAKTPILIAARERGPGPGRYALPSCVGFENHDCTKLLKPAYSFGRRLYGDVRKRDINPGPAYYIDPKITKTGADGTPIYSMLARQRDPNTFKTPSPGKYSPEKVHPQGEKHAPRYSMGSRTRYRKRDANPAPSKYMLPPVLGSHQSYKVASPAYSMVKRQSLGSYLEDLASAPGPGRYDAIPPDNTMDKPPQYSMRYRCYMPTDAVKKPGPGAHRPENVYINKAIPPKHSIGIRHSEYVCPLIIGFDS
ncbi:ciliary microtubule associated protein 1A-like [Mytilus galloprovincialis]|uniref:ciliary microtubule associated protein 1A-like n=1 Tax=Mytilus edulis TaxID=6550 RepID=UPI0039EF2506